MKKTLLLFITILFACFTLVACSGGNENEDTNKDEANETEEASENENSEEESVQEEEAEETEEEVTEDSTSSADGKFEVTEEDQLDLKVGDTAVLQTSIGTFELTVDAAEIVGAEFDGGESLLDELIILDLTFKNIDDRVIDAADIMYTFEITSNLDGSGFTNGAEDFPSIEEFAGEIQPGEERTAQFIGDIHTSEEYYFRQDTGSARVGTSNMVIWTITDEEARN